MKPHPSVGDPGLLNGWFTAAVVLERRRAALAAPCLLDDRELKNAGIYRDRIADVTKRNVPLRSRRLRPS